MLQRLPFGVRGVVFDLDGTLTVPCINFKDMRRRTGILEGDILKVMQTLPQDRKVHVARVIEELEEDGRQRMRLQPGLLRVMECLDIHKLPVRFPSLGIVLRGS